MLVAFIAGSAIGTSRVDEADMGSGESGRADRVLADAFPERATETVFVQSDDVRATAPAFRAAVDDVVGRMRALDQVRAVRSPYAPGNEGQIAPGGRAALVQVELRGDVEEAEARIDEVLAQTRGAQARHPDLRIEQFGRASAGKALSKMFEDDFRKAELISIPTTLAILIVAFGALVAAGLPVLLALSSVMATLGLVAIGSHVVPVEETVSSVVLLIGLAVGVDYSLFYLRREREERAAGRGPEAALHAAAATSGRAVLISGLTVMIAMAGMFIAGNGVFTGIAMGAILVVGVSLIASLTVLPALLSKLGDRVERGRVPLIGRRRADGDSRLWSATLDAVLRRPRVAVLLAGGGLLALSVPVLGMKTALPGTESLPRSLPVMQTFDRIQAAFPGQQIEAVLAVSGADDLDAPAARAALEQLRADARASRRIHDPVTVELSADRRVARIALPIDGDGTDGRRCGRWRRSAASWRPRCASGCRTPRRR